MVRTGSIAYITNALLTLKDAQSIQISSMAMAFHRLLGDQFVLVTPANRVILKAQYWRGINCFFRRSPNRYYEFSVRMFCFLLFSRPKGVITRDMAVAVSAALLGIPVVYEFHKESKNRLHEFIYRLFRARIKVIAISEALGEFLVRAYKTPAGNLLVAHDGVFVELYDDMRTLSKEDIRRELGIPVDKTVILHSGHLYKGRGAEYFRVIAENFPQILMVSVGGTKQDLAVWENEYCSIPNILLVPHKDQEQLRKYQMCADALLYPMTTETDTYWCCSPLKIFEYMATGCPIIGVDIGSIKEILNEGNSIIYQQDKKGDLCEKVNWYLTHRSAALQRSQVALKEVREKYTWIARARRIIEFMGKPK